MPFHGERQSALAYTINVDNGQIGAGKTLKTIVKINRRDTFASAEAEIIGPGARAPFNGTAGARITHVIVKVNPPPYGTVNVDVRQGATTYSDTFTGDRDLAFEIVP